MITHLEDPEWNDPIYLMCGLRLVVIKDMQ